MICKKSLKFLEKFLTSSGPSGFEEETAKCFREYIEPFAHVIKIDVTGNTIAVLNPDSEFKVMLAGHYDEIGFQITHVSDEGLLYFRTVGGIDKLTVPCLEVEIITEENGKIKGIIGKKPIHLLSANEREKVTEIKDMWIDIGAESKKEAEKIITIGDPVAFKSNFEFFGKNRIKSKGLDDKIGAFVVAEAFRILAETNIDVGVYAVGTVQEELGLRGAATSAFGINPNVGIAVDVGFSTDLPDIDKKQLGEGKLGQGPFLDRNADNNPVLGRKIRKIAKKFKIPVQERAGYRASGGTDTARMQLTRSGVATALISIPNRYMHTPVEMCDLRDVESAINLIVQTVKEFKHSDSFVPGS